MISYYLILFRPISAVQVAAIKNLFHFYLSLVAIGQIYFVSFLIPSNHNARCLYPEMDISRIALGDLKPVLKREKLLKDVAGGAIVFNSFLKDYVFVPLLISSV